jgi:phytol kinase
MKKEMARKALHSILALIFAYSPFFLTKENILLLALCLLGIFLLVRGMRLYTPLHQVPRITYGELFFASGVLVALIVSWSSIVTFQLAMIVLAIADPLAGLVGMRFGKHIYYVFKEKRSFEGSVTCGLVTLYSVWCHT